MKDLIKVLHFDRAKFFSRTIREKLVEAFKKYPNVEYQDFMQDHYGEFEENKEELELLLPRKDILLIHPGRDGQKRVFEYGSLFPNLKIAFLIPGSFSDYEEMNGIRLYSYDEIKSIEKFVLETK